MIIIATHCSLLLFKATINTSPSNGEQDGNIDIVATQGTNQSKDADVPQDTNKVSRQRSQVDEVPAANQPIDVVVAQDTNQVSSQRAQADEVFQYINQLMKNILLMFIAK